MLNEQSYVSASFVLKDVDSSGYEALMDYGQRFRAGSDMSGIRKPSTSAVPQTKKYNGLTYQFDGWYTDANCTNKTDFSGTIDTNMTFYGRYVPTNARYRVEYYYDGVIDASLTETGGPADIGSQISGYTDKKKTGFNLSEVTPSVLTISEDESANVIRVYYTKRLVSYKVCYYLNGTTEQIAPPVTGNVKFGELATGKLKEIEGYTPVSDADTQNAVVEAAGTEIIFYYYKNTVLTAGSAEYTYDGTEKSVTGYTADNAAVFENITAGAKGTGAGTYKSTFSDGAVGTVDVSGRFIVSDTVSGNLVIAPRAVTVSANPVGKSYGAEDPELTVVISGAVPGEEGQIQYTIERDPGDDVGTYPIRVTGESEQGNYIVTYDDSEFTVTKSGELAVNAAGYEGVYDGQAHSVTAAATVPDGTTLSYSTDGGNTWSTTAPSITNVGDITVIVRAENDKYEPAEMTVVLKITPKPVTITVNDAVKTYGDEDPELTAEVSGLIGDDTIAYELSRETGSGDDGGENVGTYSINVQADEQQGNYIVTTVSGTMTITAATLDIPAVTDSGMYDGNPVTGGLPEGEAPESATVTYSVDGGETWTDEIPERTDAGTTEYLIKVEDPNFETAYISGIIKQEEHHLHVRRRIERIRRRSTDQHRSCGKRRWFCRG